MGRRSPAKKEKKLVEMEDHQYDLQEQIKDLQRLSKKLTDWEGIRR